MNEILDTLEKYDFEKANKGDKIIVATLNYGILQSFMFCTVKSVSSKLGRVTLDNGLRYSRDGYEYGRESFSTNTNLGFSYTKENVEQVNNYLAREAMARKIMKQRREITKEKLMDMSLDILMKLNTMIEEVLNRRADNERQLDA